MARATHEVKVRLTAEDKASKELKKASEGVDKLSSSVEKSTAKVPLLSKELEKLRAEAAKLSTEIDKTGEHVSESAVKMEEADASVEKLSTSFSTKFAIGAAAAAAAVAAVVKGYQEVVDAALRVAATQDPFSEGAQSAKEYTESLNAISTSFENLKAEIGFAIIENEALLGTLNELNNVMSSGGLVGTIDDVATATSNFVTATIDEVKALNDVARALDSVGDYYSQFVAFTRDLSGATEDAQGSSEGLAHSLDGVASSIVGKILGPLRELGALLTATAKAERDTVATNDAMAASFQKQVTEILKFGTSLEVAREAFEEFQIAQGKAIEDSDFFNEQLRKIGVTLESEYSVAFEKNNRLLEISNELYRTGEISRRDFEVIERSIIDAEQALTDKIYGTNTALDDSVTSFDAATRGAENYAGALDIAREAARALAEQETIEAAKREDFGQQSRFGGTTSGGSKLFPGSAIANTAIVNGVRYRVLPDGRRVRV